MLQPPAHRQPQRQAAPEHGLDGKLEGEAAGREQGLKGDGHEADLAGKSLAEKIDNDEQDKAETIN
ncbi:hypothetical protein METHP14_870015 [Pseudomonas sp. P14-2025]